MDMDFKILFDVQNLDIKTNYLLNKLECKRTFFLNRLIWAMRSKSFGSKFNQVYAEFSLTF
jgi:hypothetical protein